MDRRNHPLATESFSYSWLTTPEEKTHSAAVLIEEHHHHHHNPSSSSTQSFNFDIPRSHHHNPSFPRSSNFPSPLVHADQLFSNGLILPSPVISNITSYPPSPATTSTDSVFSPSLPAGQTQIPPRPLKKSRRSSCSGNLMRRLLGCTIAPEASTRVDDFCRRTHEVVVNNTYSSRRTHEVVVNKTFSSSSTAVVSPDHSTTTVSPATSVSSSATSSTPTRLIMTSSASEYNESSILEAILYCKRSSGGVYTVPSD